MKTKMRIMKIDQAQREKANSLNKYMEYDSRSSLVYLNVYHDYKYRVTSIITVHLSGHVNFKHN